MGERFIWWKHGVFYQIYPRSFMDSNGDGVGDLQGITQRMDYLADLGVDALWISPIYPSPMADFGYDVSDYMDIHPLFGDLVTFDRLLTSAHEHGLHVVLDFVPNHTSDEHPWFVESRASRQSPRRSWFIWQDAKPDGSPPNNWESFFGGSAWQWDEATSQYYLHLFLEKQPDLNWRNPQVVKAMHKVLRFWLDKGVDGFRMDVVTFLIKHPSFQDNPIIPDPEKPDRAIQEHRYDINQPEIHAHLRQFRHIFDSYPGDRVTIGETWFMNPKELVSYYGKSLDELHLPFNFITLRQPWQAQAIRQAIHSYYAALPPGAAPNFVFGNHDVHRLATRYGVENHRSVALLLLTLRGVPTIYYGDELGMQDIQVPAERLQDPVARRKPGSDEGRDPERAPMLWDNSPNAGFTPAGVQPWLPLPENYPRINVLSQRVDPTSTLNFYKRLLRLRRELPVLQRGDFDFVDQVPDNVLAYTRRMVGQHLLMVVNFSGATFKMDLSSLEERAEVLLSTQDLGVGTIELAELTLQPYEGLILKLL